MRPWLALAVVLAALAPLAGGTLAQSIATQVAIAAIFATSYNTLLAGCGLLSFGHAAYLGVGAFAVAHVLRWIEAAGAPVPVPLLPLVGAAAGAAAAVLFGWFTTRRGWLTFSMLSLAVGQLLLAAGAIFAGLTGGEGGLRLDRTAGLALPGGGLASQAAMYACALAWAVPCLWLMYRFRRTPLGRLAAAVRENEERVPFLGVPPAAVRYRVLVAAATFAGAAGGLYAMNYEVVTLEVLGLAASGAVLLQTILGGPRHFLGPAVGAALVTLLGTHMSAHTEIGALYLGLLFVGVVLFVPEGVVGQLAQEAAVLRAAGWRGGVARVVARHVPAVGAVVLVVAVLETLHAAREGLPGPRFAGLALAPDAVATWAGLAAGGALVAGWAALARRA